MLLSRPILSVSDSPAFGRVLQCPVLVGSGDDHLALILSSRDADNRSRTLGVRIDGTSGTSPQLVRCDVLLTAADVDPDCVGLMIGDVVRGVAGMVAVGNAYFLGDGVLGSRLFVVPVEIGNSGLRVAGEVRWLFEEDEGTFRATPAVVVTTAGMSAFYPRAERDAARGSGFPPEYRLQRVPLTDDFQPCGDERPVLVGEQPGAWAKAAQDPDDPATVWFCHRDVLPDQAGYRLGRLTLGETSEADTVELSANGGWGQTPPHVGMLAYPEPLPGGDVLACAGDYGSSGVVLLSERARGVESHG